MVKRRRALQAGLSIAALPVLGSACTPHSPPHPVEPPEPYVPPISPPPVASSPPPQASATATASAPPPAPSAPPQTAPLTRVVAKVGTNHGHVFNVPLADVKAGVEKTYDITGSASHPHTVTLTVDQLKRVAAGEVVRTPSTLTGHLHRLLIKLAPEVDPPELANVCEIKIGGKDDHELAITAADMAARKDKGYEIQGISPHGHAVQITAADFEKLHKGEQVTVKSAYASPGEDHFHLVFIRYPQKG